MPDVSQAPQAATAESVDEIVSMTIPADDETSTQEVKSENIPVTTFTSEKTLEGYVYDNILLLWKEIFDEVVTKATRQYIEPKESVALQGGGTRPTRIDLFVECESGNNYLVEIKNPTSSFDTIYAIGKLLFYSTVFPEANKYVVLSTLYDRQFDKIISKYQLPIDFILLTKDKAYLLKR